MNSTLPITDKRFYEKMIADNISFIDLDINGKTIQIEIAPVRHGRWIINDRDDGFHCSECNHFVPWDNTFALDWNKQLEYYKYCRCGAKMDLSKGE